MSNSNQNKQELKHLVDNARHCLNQLLETDSFDEQVIYYEALEDIMEYIYRNIKPSSLTNLIKGDEKMELLEKLKKLNLDEIKEMIVKSEREEDRKFYVDLYNKVLELRYKDMLSDEELYGHFHYLNKIKE
ncbi:hypothetical protein [Turicibacter sp.]|uniref:hypothetical protein n=1 Tax=Turicibacter sp. TaxID=2049042 RepID=UPI001B7B779B|nr:hypothetical protein [Turicibacter sp.]MBP3905042.1 hypothetical protein [Turicibacter sp.]MBP3908051.1 hypothetical protein [Turicibacter sp.]